MKHLWTIGVLLALVRAMWVVGVALRVDPPRVDQAGEASVAPAAAALVVATPTAAVPPCEESAAGYPVPCGTPRWAGYP